MTEKVKIVFDPAFFETFDGTQEELDELLAEIHSMVNGKTAEEIMAMSQPVDWDEMDEDEAERLQQVINNAKNDIKPTLQ